MQASRTIGSSLGSQFSHGLAAVVKPAGEGERAGRVANPPQAAVPRER